MPPQPVMGIIIITVALVSDRTIPSDCHLSSKLVSTFADTGVSCGQPGG
jgi:hypothetical protein